jgi:hypothetical protein
MSLAVIGSVGQYLDNHTIISEIERSLEDREPEE